MTNMLRVVATSCALAMTSVAADELHFNIGGLHATPHTEATYSWALEYRQPLGDRLIASVTWLNEGHLRGHHRDGQATQLWWQVAPSTSAPQFRLGLGPYYYYDTIAANNSDGYANAHGWDWLASAEAAWQLDNRWNASIRLNRVQARHSIDSTALVAGLGYRFGAIDRATATQRTSAWASGVRYWELDGLAGATIVNSYDSDAELAKAVGLRRHLHGPFRISLTYINEGDIQRGRRAGVAPQVWLEDELTPGVSVGVGLGPYFALRKPRDADGETASRVAALVSVTAAYAINPDWTGRLI